MKKQKIKVKGIKYKYIITEENTIRIDGIVPSEIYEEIKSRLIKQGKYQETKKETITVHYNEKYLERRFQKWSLVELKMYRDELEEKIKDNTITSEEKLCVQPVREEIERRTKHE
jgi:hypothetical protein